MKKLSIFKRIISGLFFLSLLLLVFPGLNMFGKSAIARSCMFLGSYDMLDRIKGVAISGNTAKAKNI